MHPIRSNPQVFCRQRKGTFCACAKQPIQPKEVKGGHMGGSLRHVACLKLLLDHEPVRPTCRSVHIGQTCQCASPNMLLRCAVLPFDLILCNFATHSLVPHTDTQPGYPAGMQDGTEGGGNRGGQGHGSGSGGSGSEVVSRQGPGAETRLVGPWPHTAICTSGAGPVQNPSGPCRWPGCTWLLLYRILVHPAIGPPSDCNALYWGSPKQSCTLDV